MQTESSLSKNGKHTTIAWELTRRTLELLSMQWIRTAMAKSQKKSFGENPRGEFLPRVLLYSRK